MVDKYNQASDQQADSQSEVDWFIYAPIVKGYCTMLELKQGAYTLEEYVDLHEAIAEMAIKEKQQLEDMKQ